MARAELTYNRVTMDIRRSEMDRYVQSEADLRSTLLLLWSRWPWILASVVLFLLVGTGVAFLTTPIYRATVVMVPAQTNRAAGALGGALGQLGGLASLAGLNLNSSDSDTEEALAVLRSRSFTENFIVDKGLVPVLFPNASKQPTLARAFRKFDEKVRTVVQDKKTGLVTLRVDWRDGIVGAQWANELVARLNAEMRGRAIVKADDALRYLERELPNNSQLEVRDAMNRLIESQIKQRMLANVTQEYAFRVVDHALPADPDDPLWPKRALLLIGGAVFGLFAGIFFVLFHQMMTRQ